ncbi:hypothetical protein D6C92_02928 [Aureobasidium pullulans]|nr:hypothetical protein D6C92_02928 [Aureobasidium pullulans]
MIQDGVGLQNHALYLSLHLLAKHFQISSFGRDLMEDHTVLSSMDPRSLLESKLSVTVKFRNNRFLATKCRLAAGSKYFERAFYGDFSVAASPVIDLGDEDDPELVLLMLRYLNGSSYSDLRCSMSMPQTLDLGISLFALADQYDVSTLRADIVDWFSMDVRNLMCFEVVPYAFQRLLGPFALFLADTSLQDTAFELCLENIETLLENQTFHDLLLDGTLLHSTFAGPLLAEVGGRLQQFKTGKRGPTKDLDLSQVFASEDNSLAST